MHESFSHLLQQYGVMLSPKQQDTLNYIKNLCESKAKTSSSPLEWYITTTSDLEWRIRNKLEKEGLHLVSCYKSVPTHCKNCTCDMLTTDDRCWRYWRIEWM